MKSIKIKVAILLVVILGCCSQPMSAQAWKPVVTKEGKAVVEKLIKSGSAKKVEKAAAEKAAEKAAQKAAQRSGSAAQDAARAGAVTTQHVHSVTCPTCRGNKTVHINGYLYTCPKCNGKGTVLQYN